MLRFLTAGESHGPVLTAILDGFPAGLEIDREQLNLQMARRQKGFGSGGRMNIERDSVRITGGVMAGRSSGGPIGMEIVNRDYEKWRDKEIRPMTIPRPGHADLTGAVKFGHGDLRLSLERASARETAARVAVGSICRQLLAEFGIEIGSYVVAIGGEAVELPADMEYLERFRLAEESEVRCPSDEGTERMVARIKAAMEARDTVGGIFEVVVTGAPAGLGSFTQWDQRLDGKLLASIGSVPAIKGAEIGPAFANSGLAGSDVQDEIFKDADGRLTRRSNRSGGFEGGITNGEPIVIRAAMKPISTVLNPMRSVDLATGQAADTVYERSDICAVPRAAVVAEAMAAFTVLQAILEKVGGDSVEEMTPRVSSLRQARVDELPMDNEPWRFDYD